LLMILAVQYWLLIKKKGYLQNYSNRIGLKLWNDEKSLFLDVFFRIAIPSLFVPSGNQAKRILYLPFLEKQTKLLNLGNF